MRVASALSTSSKPSATTDEANTRKFQPRKYDLRHQFNALHQVLPGNAC